MDKETKDKLVKAAKKKSRSLPIMVMESDWYDYNAVPGTCWSLSR
jgi:hypothetical protein